MAEYLRTKLFVFVVVPLIILVVIPLTILILPVWLLEGAFLRLWFWYRWKVHGQNIILTTSNSPKWKDYMTEFVIPHAADNAMVLNWSERKSWRQIARLPAWARERWVGRGQKGHCPSIVFMKSILNIETISLYEPFRLYNRGDATDLENVLNKFFADLEAHNARSR